MNRSEEVPHIRSFFRQNQYDEEKKIWLVTQLRDIAIEQLEPVKAKIPRVLPDWVREAYQAKGISLEWDLTTTDAYEFSSMARNAGVSPSQQSAANLLDACTRALEKNAVSDRTQQHILDAYAGLDADAVNTGVRFIAGRKTNSGGPIRKIIAKMLKKNTAMKNPELWAAVTAKPPRGWTFVCFGKRLEVKQGQGAMTQGRFFNVCGEERKKLKQ